MPFSSCIEDNSGTMDLFGGADDISSGSDGEDKPPTPGQPVVSKITNENWKRELSVSFMPGRGSQYLNCSMEIQ